MGYNKIKELYQFRMVRNFEGKQEEHVFIMPYDSLEKNFINI